ncbi:MAG: ABC transporter ATP-binding protein, partial [Akkermansia sp.]|nr:ABC transporter ATP-binding protein [Akkermansia sp.]
NRQFLDPVVNKVLEFRTGLPPRLFHGNVSQYLETVEAEERRQKELAQRTPETPSAASAPASLPNNRKESRRLRAMAQERRNTLIRPLERRLAEVEEEIAQKDERKAAIAEELENPENMSDNQRLMELTQEYQALERETDALFTVWEDVSAELERANAALEEEFPGVLA